MDLKKLVLIFFTLLTQSSLAVNYPINYSVKDGIPSSQVYDIFQMTSGYLWFATDHGICKYDGYTFKKYGIEDGLTDNTVFKFFPQQDGTIWCSTMNNELFYFDEDERFQPYKFNRQLKAAKNNSLISQLFFRDNDLYISYNGISGYIKISEKGEVLDQTTIIKDYDTRLIIEAGSEGSFSYIKENKYDIERVIPDGQFHESVNGKRSRNIGLKFGETFISAVEENIYLETKEGVKIIDGTNYIIAIGVYDQDHFWVGYLYGGMKIFTSTGALESWDLNGKSVTDLYIDHEGGKWCSTLYSGVFYFGNSEMKRRVKTSESVRTLTAVGDTLFASYDDGHIDAWYNGKSNRVYTSKIKIPSLIQYYESIGVVAWSDNNLFSINKPEKPLVAYRSITALSDNVEKEMVFGWQNGFCMGADITNLEVTNVRANDIAMLGEDYYLASLDGIFKYESISDSLVSQQIVDYRSDDIDTKRGIIYAATRKGVLVFNEHYLYRISTKHGLFSDEVSEIYLESDSVLWACTNKGLNRIQLKSTGELEVTGVAMHDGLISNEVVDVEVLNGNVWIGTKEGLVIWDEDYFINKRRKTPDHYLQITRVRVNDKEVEINALKSLEYEENRLEINFNAISFKSTDLVYRYRLIGFDKKWYVTKQREILYAALPPGDYKFVLQAAYEHGEWEQSTSVFSIRIFNPFYLAWWFWLLVAALLGVLIWSFFKLYILTYNKDVVRELLRYLLKKVRKKEKYVTFKYQGRDLRLATTTISYVKAAGNYVEIFTDTDRFLVRCKIGEFLDKVPDPIEFARIHRSYIVRLDKVTSKNSKVVIINNDEIPVSESFKEELIKIQF